MVKWKNYPVKESSWEPIKNLENAQESIEEFHEHNPAAPRRVCMMPMTRKYENFTNLDVPRKLYGWEDGKFGRDWLEWLEKAWEKWRGPSYAMQWDDEEDNKFSRTKILRGG